MPVDVMPTKMRPSKRGSRVWKTRWQASRSSRSIDSKVSRMARKRSRFSDANSSGQRALHVLERVPHSVRGVVLLQLILQVRRVAVLQAARELQHVRDRGRALAQPAVGVLLVLAAVLHVQAHDALEVLAEEGHGVVAGRREVADVEVDGDARRAALERLRVVVRALEV